MALSLPGLRVEVRSNLGAFSATGERREDEAPSWLLGLIRPELVVSSGGTEVVRYAPAGSPSELAARVVPVLLAAGALGLLGLAIYGAARLLR